MTLCFFDRTCFNVNTKWYSKLFFSFTKGMGLLDIPIPYDEASERYFDQFRNSKSNPPSSYNAVTAGNKQP